VIHVRDLMTAKVFAIRTDKNVSAVDELMRWAHIRHVPIVDERGSLVGLISHRDLLAASTSSIKKHIPDWDKRRNLWTVPIDEIMSRELQTIGPGETVQEAARRMRRHKIGCLPVVEGSKLVGIITAYDLLEIVAKLTPAGFEDIAAALTAG